MVCNRLRTGLLLACISVAASAQVAFAPPGDFTKDSLTGEFTTTGGRRITRATTNIITEFKFLSENSFSQTVSMYREAQIVQGTSCG